MLTEKQIQERRSGIGASEAAVVMGISKWATPYELWMVKTGKVEPDNLNDRIDVYWGSVLEGVIADRYEILFGEKLKKNNKTLRHKQYPHMLCHLDRVVHGKKKLIEIKTANAFSQEWGEEGSDHAPEQYIWQVQQQLAITGYEEGELVVFRGTHEDLKVYNIPRDERLIKVLIEECNSFWELVKTNTPPPFSNRHDVEMAYPMSNGNFKQAPDEAFEAIQKLKELKGRIKENEFLKAGLENIIVQAIGEHDGLYFSESDKKPIVTWKQNKNGSRVLRIS